MTRLSLLLVLLLAGCATPSNNVTTAAVPYAPTDAMKDHSEALSLHGTYWMPMVVGSDMGHGNVTLPLDESNLSIVVKLHVGMRQGGVASPASPAMVIATLVDSSNTTVGSMMIMPPDADGSIETTNATAGPAKLHFDTRGGSDGSQNGDFVEYTITTTARQG